MDPASVITAVRATTTIASVLLRGISALFGSHPIDPYRYYRLGSLIQRFYDGQLTGISLSDRDYVWMLGVQPRIAALTPFEREHYPQITQAYMARKKLGRVSVLASSLLNRRGVSFLQEFKEPPPSHDQHWIWLELGQAEYRDRLQPKLRAILGDDPDLYRKKLWAAGLAKANTRRVYEEMKTPDTAQAYVAACLLYDPMAARHKQLQPLLKKAWKDTPAAIDLKSAEAAKNELTRWVAAREETKKRSLAGATGDALWFGSPVPWSLELAAHAYGQHGAAAVIQYASVSRRVTRDLRILLQRISPAAITDPVLVPFLR